MFEGIKRLLSSENGGEGYRAPSSKPTGERKASSFYNITRASNYDVSVTIKGSCPYTSCILSAVAVSGTGEAKYPLAARHAWKKIFKSQEMDLPCTADTLHLSPMDAGHYIKVEILPTEEPETYSEMSSVIFGPIVLDPAIKRNLQNVMRAGGGKFKIDKLSLPEAEEAGTMGQVLVNSNTLIISTVNNPKVFLKLDLRDKFKLFSQRTHLQTFMLDLGNDQYSNLLTTMFNLPRIRNFRRLKLTMDSSTKKDQLFVAINIFRNLLSLRDNDIRETVNRFLKQDSKRPGDQASTVQSADQVTGAAFEISDDDSDLSDTEDPTSKVRRLALKKQRIEHLELKGKNPNGYKMLTFPDPLERLFLQEGMKEEIHSLYNHNKKIAEENNQLQKKMADLKVSNSKGFWDDGPSRHEVVDKTLDMTQNGDANKIQIVNQKNQELEVYIKEMELNKQQLKKEADRLAKVLKNIRYKELLESKLNATVGQAKLNASHQMENTLNNSNLQAAMEDYLKEYRRIVEQIQPSSGGGTKQRSMLDPEENSLSMVDEMDDKTNHINMKNERLKEDIQRFKHTIQEYEATLKRTTNIGGIVNASFLGNESFAARPPNRMRPEVKHEYEMKISQAEGKLKKLQRENSELTEQIAQLKKGFSEAEVENQDIIVAKKLNQQLLDMKRILDSKKKQVRELMQERIRLTDKEMDIREANKKVSEQEFSVSQKKVETEKKLMLLTTELRSLQKIEQHLDSELTEMAEAGGANMSMVSQLSAKLADQSNLPGLRQTVALLQSRISTLLANQASQPTMKSMHNSAYIPVGNPKDPQLESEIQKQKSLQQKLLDEIVRLSQETKKNDQKLKEGMLSDPNNNTLMLP
jgi:hypothetical protein